MTSEITCNRNCPTRSLR